MSIQTRLRETSDVGGVGGASSGSTAGLANTSATYVLSSLDATLINALYIKPGSSVTTHITGSNMFINATTSTFAGSGGLAGTGLTYILSSFQAGYPGALYIKPGSSVTAHITGSNLFINATTSLFAGSSGLAGKDAVYVLSTFNAQYTNAVYLRPGSSVTMHITESTMYINATTSVGGSSTGLAGKDAVYVLSTFNAEYTNAVYLRPGSSVTTHITGSTLFINATTSAGASSSGSNFWQLLPQQAKLYPNNSAATIDAGTAWWRLLFSSTTQQYGVWQFIVPPDYSGSPSVRLAWAVGSTFATALSSTWIVEQFAIDHDITINPVSYLYLDTFGGANTVSVALSAGYSSGTIQLMTITLATVVSLGAGRLTHIRISGSGVAVGNRILAGANFQYARQ